MEFLEIKSVNNADKNSYDESPDKTDSANGTRKLQDEINMLTKRNCGEFF